MNFIEFHTKFVVPIQLLIFPSNNIYSCFAEYNIFPISSF